MKFWYGCQNIYANIYGSKFSGKRREGRKRKYFLKIFKIFLFGNDNFFFDSDMTKNFFLWQNLLIKISINKISKILPWIKKWLKDKTFLFVFQIMKMKIWIITGSWSLKIKCIPTIDKGQKEIESWNGQWFIQETRHQGNHNNNFHDHHSTTNLKTIFF